MKISKIYINDFQQFKNFELDLTYPKGHAKEGQPLDKVCFIGRNGTGKSTLLEQISKYILSWSDEQSNIGNVNKKAYPDFMYKVEINKNSYYSFPFIKNARFTGLTFTNYLLNCKIEEQKELFNQILHYPNRVKHSPIIPKSDIDLLNSIKDFIEPISTIKFNKNTSDILIYCPSEGTQNNYKSITDVPNTTLDKALPLLTNFPFYHEVSTDTISSFWNILIYQIKKRENDYRIFEAKPENQNKIVKDVKKEFDKIHPLILTKVAELWNKILEKAGLEFDVESASNPIQLTDNLKAYIRLISTKEKVNYHQLSTGIRNFIFRLGHIYSLYFNRNIERGFLLIDEPENSLYPDFLYDLIETYIDLTQNTQLFVSTHNPIIAAQFEPYERFILDFDENANVIVRKGTIPIGDDPNDILTKDFFVRNLMGKEGIKKWERYIELKTLIQKEKDIEIKSKLADEFIEIGNSYNFDINAIS